MEQLEDKVRLLKLQEEKAGLMRKDVIIEEKLCDVKVVEILLLCVTISNCLNPGQTGHIGRGKAED